MSSRVHPINVFTSVDTSVRVVGTDILQTVILEISNLRFWFKFEKTKIKILKRSLKSVDRNETKSARHWKQTKLIKNYETIFSLMLIIGALC